MEKVKNMPLKRAFIYVVCCAVILITVLSGITIYGCYRLQKIILPASNEAVLMIISTDLNGNTSEDQYRFEFGKETSLPIGFAVGIGYDGEPDPEEFARAEENMAAEFTVNKIDTILLFCPQNVSSFTLLCLLQRFSSPCSTP